MDEKVERIVRQAIVEIIKNTVAENNIQKSRDIHENKVHFIPVKYRVLGGLLQSLNIKFGNFIEKLIALVVENDSGVEALPASGRKIPLSMTPETDALIDQYITRRQLPDSPDECDPLFHELLGSIVNIENNSTFAKQTIRKDVDTLFKTKTGRAIYLEIKYNDDHDTGKFVDINRKMIKTFAGLVTHLGITNLSQLTPMLYYFNPAKRWGPIYVPSSHILRGQQLFDQYFEMKYQDVDQFLRHLSDDTEIMAVFDKLYQSIRYSS